MLTETMENHKQAMNAKVLAETLALSGENFHVNGYNTNRELYAFAVHFRLLWHIYKNTARILSLRLSSHSRCYRSPITIRDQVL